MIIHYLPALNDNYIWLISIGKNNVVVVDPGEALPVNQWLMTHHHLIAGVLLTHDHADHVGGLEDLQQDTHFPVYGQCRFTNKHDKQFRLSDDITVDLIDTPGHTEKSVCYLVRYEKEAHVFCGDTLFSAGCGRVFTGDYSMMFQSLKKLQALENACWLYPGHEYTLKNLAFAAWLEPHNQAVQHRLLEAKQQWRNRHCTLPSTIGLEKRINPFFRCEESAVAAAVSQKVGRIVTAGLDCFTELRKLKDYF